LSQASINQIGECRSSNYINIIKIGNVVCLKKKNNSLRLAQISWSPASGELYVGFLLARLETKMLDKRIHNA